MAQGPGWAAGADVSAEELAAHWDQVRASDGFIEVENALTSLAPLMKLRAQDR
jgi:hypothetical protein